MFTRSGSRHDCEFLDAAVAGVDNVQVPVAVEGQAVRGEELAGAFPLHFAESDLVLAVAGESLDAAAARADPQAVLFVDTDIRSSSTGEPRA